MTHLQGSVYLKRGVHTILSHFAGSHEELYPWRTLRSWRFDVLTALYPTSVAMKR